MPVFRRPGRNVLFVHVPKAGGSSIERVFAKSGYTTLYRDPKLAGDAMNKLRRCSPQHMHGAMLDQLFRLELFDLVFMIVREPLARFRSEYAMRNTGAGCTEAAAVEQWFEQAARKYSADPFVYDNHLRPQVEFHLPRAQVYRLEDGLENAVADLNARWDLDLAEDVPRVMDRKAEAGFASSDVQVSAALERRLRAVYSEDFTKFGYA